MTGPQSSRNADGISSELTFLWLEITAKCNLECRHCYADSGPHQDLLGAMDLADWMTVIRGGADVGCRQVQFIGGEPTLHPALEEMLSFAAIEEYAFIEVFTNATAIRPKLIEALLNARACVATSFYSDDPLTHDAITKRTGSFRRTVDGIERLLGAGVHVRAGVIEMKENAGHVPRAERFLTNLGVTQIGTDFSRAVGRGASHVCPDVMTPLCGDCWRGKLCVTAAGRVYPCVFARFLDLGPVKDGIGTLLRSDELNLFRRTLKQHSDDKFQKLLPIASERIESLHNSDTAHGIVGIPVHGTCAPEVRCEPTCSPALQFCMPSSKDHPLRCQPDSRCEPTAPAPRPKPEPTAC